MKINIQESLKERDSITENRYNLYNTYTANNYTAEQKKKIAEAIYKGATDTELLEMLDDSEVEYREVQEYAKANSNRRFRDEDGNIFSIWDLLNDFIDWELDDKVEEAQEFLASKVSDWEDLDESCKLNTVKSKLTESVLEVNQGDLVDFGPYGKLYVCNPNYHDDYY